MAEEAKDSGKTIFAFGQANYSASKGGIIAFTRTLALKQPHSSRLHHRPGIEREWWLSQVTVPALIGSSADLLA